ncbi:uncharacterized protein MONOS_11152 [Monocercomonoides exilis]|uniref:uncharacterized protein n=1 Tax=Monocercomonoides exilis TaxID=2049356 RepID=UPI00355AA17D|nr:hypothetical protein MONOS_11152 [Monocercomonoides exilis]|eukprot:MONOS_11152.1-p1 / transcript=MONOS_11152.1 / gene=MONOS_11152 / organism=Monocercomonoides_exilis_PA203 / gene_product=unspecified product / transcript_product=unspecified product / location=Mono_scaffold00545:5759-6230(-) / protein_length=127 / sequence_SO=supercontig / SO=protein_coding / is_pseudo=false
MTLSATETGRRDSWRFFVRLFREENEEEEEVVEEEEGDAPDNSLISKRLSHPCWYHPWTLRVYFTVVQCGIQQLKERREKDSNMALLHSPRQTGTAENDGGRGDVQEGGEERNKKWLMRCGRGAEG